jgi:NAD+ diphosphatase
LNDTAFFFQGDMLLLPPDIPDSQMDREIPLDYAKNFDNPDIFAVPALENPASAAPAVRGVSVSPANELPPNWKSIPVRQALALLSNGIEESAALGRMLRAFHIARWRRESRFCGSCGAKNNDVPAEAQRICPACGREEFPRIAPAVIVIITDDEDRILLAHNKRFKKGVYSHIAGFNEAGESLESTVVREIREEVNIEVRDIVYIMSQPWPFSGSLMLGFSARYSSGTIRPDGIEIEDAAWFSRDNLPSLPTEGSLSRFLINSWLQKG